MPPFSLKYTWAKPGRIVYVLNCVCLCVFDTPSRGNFIPLFIDTFTTAFSLMYLPNTKYVIVHLLVCIE